MVREIGSDNGPTDRYEKGIMDNRTPRRICTFLLLALFAAIPASAQYEEVADTALTEEPSRKRWHLMRRPRERTSQRQLERARTLEAAGKSKAALRQFDALVRTWPESTEAAHAQHAVARLYEHLVSLDKAFDEYQYLVRNYSRIPTNPRVCSCSSAPAA